MYSVKPGRGPAQVAIVYWIVGALAIGATAIALASGKPEAMFVIFGVWFALVAIASVSFALHCAFAKKRMSLYDVEDAPEKGESATAEGRRTASAGSEGQAYLAVGAGEVSGAEGRKYPGDFCPFCGARIEASFRHCPGCGKEI